MKVRTTPTGIIGIGLMPLLLGLSALTQAASALEACVRCDNPFAIYRCQVDQPGLPANASISLICITELAKKNGHATCAVSRETGEACSGEIVAVTPSPHGPVPQAPPAEIVAQPPGSEGNEPQTAADPSELTQNDEIEPTEAEPPTDTQTPNTVEELAKQTAKGTEKTLKQAGGAVVDAAKTTGKTIENTGNAIGNAAKKTWQCLSSLFGNC